MYSDEKTWTSHYKDWKHILDTVKHQPSDVPLEKHQYRLKIITDLVKIYEGTKH